MLAGSIVQVRLERKALSAAVGPTCCSGREQRSKTALAGGAIPLTPFPVKATLRKELRARRSALEPAEHRQRSAGGRQGRHAAGRIQSRARASPCICPSMRDGYRRTHRRGPASAGYGIFVPVISDLAHCRLRFLSAGRQDAAGARSEFPFRRLRLPPLSPQWLDLIIVPLVGVDARGAALGHGRWVL